MSTIISWITSSFGSPAVEPQQKKEDINDWTFLEEINKKEDDAASSIATIEPVRVKTLESSMIKQDSAQINSGDFKGNIEQIAAGALSNLNQPKRPQPTLAQIKDKEMKIRKMKYVSRQKR
ncbi:hypothetical protein HDV01_003373 [Terramyces sp. JEL0728]|nr:hypothetical protein HDV01_005161 [Terramyces sp. JEL0728]KAJ3268160.1 hypothetical protein HDV01_003373 [Terramyces sp. JEL0728]